MDYDLFQSDDDEDILTAFNEATQRLQQETPSHQIELDNQDGEDDEEDDDGLDILPEFNCTGRDTPKANSFPRAGFVHNGFTQHHPPYSKWDQICTEFNKEQLQVNAVTHYLYTEACKNVQKLFAAVAGQQQLQAPTTLSNSIWYRTRQQVTQFYHLILRILDENICNEAPRFLEDLRHLLNNLLDAEAWKVLYFAEHSKGNECQAPAYHLYHGVLEWRFLDLILLNECHGATEAVLLSQLEHTLDDLVLCASHHYRSKHRPELIHTSAFMCRCTKELWLLLVELAPKWLLQSHLDIWDLFHKAMQSHKAVYFQADSNAVSLAFHEFYAWLRLSLARLCDYTDHEEEYKRHLGAGTPGSTSENFQTASLLKQFLSSQPDEQQRRVYLCLLAPLELQRGRPDPDVLCQLWEYLHRSLNCNFNAGTELEQLPLTCPSGSAYVERYSKLLSRDQLEDLNLSSFTMYAWMLGRTLKLLPAQQGKGNQRQKLLGRIFSKFSAAKLLALNEPGIHHVIELFLCLLLSHEDLSELAPKLREMLLCLAIEKLPPVRRILVAKGHMALLLLHARHRLSMDDYVAKLLGQLAAIRNDVEVAAIYVGTLQAIFDLADDFARGEQLLLGPWLTNYVEKCGQASQDRVWQALHSLIQRLGEPRVVSGNASGMKEALQQQILPLLRTQYVSGHSSWLPRLAAEFVGLDKDREKLMVSFLQGPEPANMAASAQLIVHLLEEGRGQSSQVPAAPSSATILQVWVKSLVLLTAQHESVAALTAHVVQLEEFQQLAIDPTSLAGREPLCAFFGALGRRAQQEDAAANARIRMQLSHRLHAYVNHFEMWLPPDRLRSELGSRFYSFLAIVIYNCPSLAYVRSKPSCFFHLAMVRFLLTTQLQAGVPPEGRLPQMVHKIFPVLLQGIGRLPYRTDAYLGKTLEQLILHWTPHFNFSPNAKLVARPYTTLLQADARDDGELAQFVLQQLVGHFLVVLRRKAGNHSGLVVTLLQQLVEGIAADQEQQLLILLRAVHTPLLEHVMFVDELEHSRGQVLSLYRIIVSHECFRRSQPARELCLSHLRSLAEKHLAHCTYFYFQMLIKLSELSPQLAAPLLPFVREQAKLVELKRGAGEDVGIRKCLQRLEKVLGVAV
ncbi:LOW QUALITY PROTEIN: protein MMS22-like [Drosophila obscura]|uniref:LOW QUALITY PROTEIN: protein MMS22-like n=1 Tax=Drosophila obscura TaxID=7282 RepID=UPI001BB29764|nr:LOW QUALITY PROTEIN: protein MMS22-like [Drosophila obscura]